MAEQFDLAALRHFYSAEHLETGGHTDDAGYHYGVSAENAIKSAMREAGLEQHWLNQGLNTLRQSPMRAHWSELTSRLTAAQVTINLYATGRRSTPLRQFSTVINVSSFVQWSIDIRYADDISTPVSQPLLAQWKSEASDFLIHFVL